MLSCLKFWKYFNSPHSQQVPLASNQHMQKKRLWQNSSFMGEDIAITMQLRR